MPPRHAGHHVERWLDRLAEENPDEHARLQELRRENPEAFRDELRGRLRKLRQHRAGMLPFDRDDDSFRHKRPHEPGRCPWSPELDALASGYREETDPQARDRIRGELKNHLAQLFDARSAGQRQQIEEIRQHLEHLRELLDAREARRQRIIENWLRAITE